MKKLLLFFSLLILILSGCQKEETDPTNISSNVYTASTWSYSSPAYYYDISVPELTSDNIKSASVNVYFSKDNGTTWIAVPFTQYSSGSNYLMGYNTKAGQVEITWIYNFTMGQGDDPNEYFGTTAQFKVVIISKKSS